MRARSYTRMYTAFFIHSSQHYLFVFNFNKYINYNNIRPSPPNSGLPVRGRGGGGGGHLPVLIIDKKKSLPLSPL